jgi:hypothetical protein
MKAKHEKKKYSKVKQRAVTVLSLGVYILLPQFSWGNIGATEPKGSVVLVL